MTYAKMAEDGVTRCIEEALNKIVKTTEQSGNMRKKTEEDDLLNDEYCKKLICDTESTARRGEM